MLNVAAALSERGCSVDVVLAQKQGEYLEHVPDTLRIVDLGVGRTLESIMPLAGYLKRERPDVLIGALSHANGIALLSRSISRTRIPVVISLHNTMSVETENDDGLRQKALRWLTRSLSPGADAIVAVSNGVADDYAKLVGIDRARIQVIYNPVVSPAMLDKSRQPVDHPWLQPGQPPVILGVGRLNPQKDFHNLLRAFAILRKGRQARLIILGQGEERASLEALVEELKIGGDVALPGFADNPFAYMAKAAVFALSSRFEGLPTVLIEAMACGCQVVSTDCPSGPREIFAAAGAGTLVPVGDPAALADGIGKCLDAGGPSLPAATWDRYTLPVAADQYLDVIQQVFENASAA
jgi:glycosyltransferase involved in cell wall biosynthesis